MSNKKLCAKCAKLFMESKLADIIPKFEDTIPTLDQLVEEDFLKYIRQDALK